MIDFLSMAAVVIVALTFFSVSVALCLMWKTPDGATKAARIRKWLLNASWVGLAGVFVSMFVSPLLGAVVLLYGIPFAAVVVFLVYLIRFCCNAIAKKRGAVPSEKGRNRTLTVFLVLSFVFAAVMVAVLACFLLLPAGSIAYM